MEVMEKVFSFYYFHALVRPPPHPIQHDAKMRTSSATPSVLAFLKMLVVLLLQSWSSSQIFWRQIGTRLNEAFSMRSQVLSATESVLVLMQD